MEIIYNLIVILNSKLIILKFQYYYKKYLYIHLRSKTISSITILFDGFKKLL